MPSKSKPPAVCIALTTFGSEEQAVTVTRSLLEDRLIACANLLPGARSLYRWQGAIEDTAEVVCLMKTTPNHLDALHRALCERHAYDVPEWVVLSPAAVGLAYGNWVAGQVQAAPMS